jgi:ABC-type multidrug transport system fused ATPase/permease subunit
MTTSKESARTLGGKSLQTRALWSTYLGKQRAHLGAMFGVLVITIALQLAAPQISRRFIDGAQAGLPTRDLIDYAIAFIVVAILIQATMVATVFLSERVGWTATNMMRSDLALHALNLDSQFHTEHRPGELTERIDGDVNTLSNFFSQFIVQVVGSAFLLAGVLVLLARVDYRLGIIYVVYTVIYMTIAIRIRGTAIPRWTASRKAAADVAGFVEERVSGLDDIRANGLGANTMNQFHRLVRHRYGLERIASLVSAKVSATLIAVITVNFAVAYLLTAYLFVEGSISLGTAFLVIQYSVLLNQPLFQFANQIEDIQKVGGSVARISDLMATESTIRDTGSVDLHAGQLSIAFDRVSFGYAARSNVLDGLSFDVGAGQILGIVGRTGSGKTTLARLLLRLYEPREGKVLIGGVDVRDIRKQSLHQHVAMVTQDVFLFQATLRDNISLFDTSISDDAILESIRSLGLSRWYDELPAGLDTYMSATTSGLSGGEAQLVALSRVFLRDPGLIVLDEPTSKLDPVSEHYLERALDRLLAGRTVVIIAHRLSTLARADLVMILHGGEIAEFGSRQQLEADPNSRFAKLASIGADGYLG